MAIVHLQHPVALTDVQPQFAVKSYLADDTCGNCINCVVCCAQVDAAMKCIPSRQRMNAIAECRCYGEMFQRRCYLRKECGGIEANQESEAN